MTDFTVDEFITEMEKLYEVEGQGYIKVLEKAKEVKKENEELKIVIENKDIDINELGFNYQIKIRALSIDIDNHKEIIEKLHNKNKELKELSKLKDQSIAELRKLSDKLLADFVETKPDMELVDGNIIHKRPAELKEENEELKDKVITWEAISKKKTNALIPFFKNLDIDYSPAFDGGDYIEECLKKVSVEIEELKKRNEKLKKSSDAWNIINGGVSDWDGIAQLCDEEMARELVYTGECNWEDFEVCEFPKDEDEDE
tara:strand:- start:981 stop:1754 length:774 start_codon:yes stop_codon:yes gene_type:complete